MDKENFNKLTQKFHILGDHISKGLIEIWGSLEGDENEKHATVSAMLMSLFLEFAMDSDASLEQLTEALKISYNERKKALKKNNIV